ncbi:spore coat protein [Ferviditalea candida]|uniref:Spore coat protein n=1 Tax=Ferviditalea candida TaxID=3108399 RepID=A0ABU5ZGM0_9BACL|nr:spore coat protein [Paenibacillaceae bacterium T2]
MAAHFGAHEVMEVHEVLSTSIEGINLFHLYRPYVKDQQLRQILDRQILFMTNEYNNLVQLVEQQGAGQAIPYRTVKNFAPTYGLDNPATNSPNTTANQMDDRDVASGMLLFHKSSAVQKMNSALECADPNLRSAIQQGAVNCSEEAYEIWQFMNQKGYYQVPTMKEMTTNTFINSYGQASSPGIYAGGAAANATQGVFNPNPLNVGSINQNQIQPNTNNINLQ